MPEVFDNDEAYKQQRQLLRLRQLMPPQQLAAQDATGNYHGAPAIAARSAMRLEPIFGYGGALGSQAGSVANPLVPRQPLPRQSVTMGGPGLDLFDSPGTVGPDALPAYPGAYQGAAAGRGAPTMGPLIPPEERARRIRGALPPSMRAASTGEAGRQAAAQAYARAGGAVQRVEQGGMTEYQANSIRLSEERLALARQQSTHRQRLAELREQRDAEHYRVWARTNQVGVTPEEMAEAAGYDEQIRKLGAQIDQRIANLNSLESSIYMPNQDGELPDEDARAVIEESIAHVEAELAKANKEMRVEQAARRAWHDQMYKAKTATAPQGPSQPAQQPAALQGAPGLLEPGTLDPFDRPARPNADGSWSTALMFSVPVAEVLPGRTGGEIVLPQVVNGQKLTRTQAIEHARKTGEHFGIFRDAQAADAYAAELHNQQEATGRPARFTVAPPPGKGEYPKYLNPAYIMEVLQDTTTGERIYLQFGEWLDEDGMPVSDEE